MEFYRFLRAVANIVLDNKPNCQKVNTDMETSKIVEAKTKLDLAVSEALKTYSKAEVKKSIEAQITRYQLMQVVSTKGGILGTLDYDKLQICIDMLRSKLSELEA